LSTALGIPLNIFINDLVVSAGLNIHQLEQ
jgi:hypothetical protein